MQPADRVVEISDLCSRHDPTKRRQGIDLYHRAIDSPANFCCDRNWQMTRDFISGSAAQGSISGRRHEGRLGSAVSQDAYIRTVSHHDSSVELPMAERVVRIKRVYVEPSEDDGERILVDRLWPRGLTKAKAKVDLWLKEVAPSNELRKWFAHDPDRWLEFKRRYVAELKTTAKPLTLLKQDASRGTVTLLYGARDEEHNEAVVLLELLQRK
jgi:uncharacterized protein YeaO (DUF488 family)